MLILISGRCPAIAEEIEGAPPKGGKSVEICNRSSRLLQRLADPSLPVADVAFVNIDGLSPSAADRLVKKAKSGSPRTTVAAVTTQSTTSPNAADFVLKLPDDLGRVGGILAETASATGQTAPRRDLERKLADLQHKTQIILDRLAEGVAVIDSAGAVIWVNKKLAELYRAPDASAFQGKTCYRTLWGLAAPCDNCPRLADSLAAEESRSLQIGDRELYLDVTVESLRDERGHLIGAIESIRDAAPRLKLEENLVESEKMKAVGLMAAGLAHELRNPLAVISSIAEYCLHVQDNEDLETGLTSIINAAGQAEKIIRELLSFARPAPDRFEAISLRDLLRTTVEMIAPGCKTQNITLAADLPRSLPSVKADRSRLQQALLNFMLNGIEAMESKGTLSITATAVERAAVEIRIADTGRGMTHEQCKRAFDPFFTTKRGGVGLGMANARKIIAAHKGQVAIHSRQGKGTTVVIVMPAMEVADNAPVERARKGTDAPKDQTGSIRRRAAARSRDRRRA